MTYRQHYSTRKTLQNQPIPGKEMVKNEAGGYVFPVDDWKRLDRFLILGSESGTYYATEQKLTIDNAQAVARCISAGGPRVVDRVVEFSDTGRAPKNDPALFVLAMCAGMGNLETRRAALNSLPQVARIGTHLFHFLEYIEGFRGWGRGLRQAVANWYNQMPIDKLAYQTVKYQQRDGWSHRDALRLAHPKSDEFWRNSIYKYITKGELEIVEGNNKKGDIIHKNLLSIVGFEEAKTADKKGVINLINTYNLTREMIPNKWLDDPAIWSALLCKMPLGALIRNLGKMTQVGGVLSPMSDGASFVANRLTDQAYIKKSRLHPLSILTALKVYAQGHGMRGKLSWRPVREIVDALDEAFYLSFGNVQPTGKRILIGVDVSGSMMGNWAHNNIAGTPLVPGEAAAALAMVTARIEKQYHIIGYDTRAYPKDISHRQRLDDVIKGFGYNSGGTDCAIPIIHALESGIKADVFITITDNDTWAGDIHPIQALAEYRRQIGIDAKLVTVGMTSSGFTIADPDDAGTLDIIGYDTATPNIISDFAKG